MLAHVCPRNIAKFFSQTTLKHNILTRTRLIHTSPVGPRKHGFEFADCKLRTENSLLSPWYLLRKIGIPNRKVVSFRRGLKRYSYPWIEYCIPVSIIMSLGDVMAQMVCLKDEEKKDYDPFRTLKFGLIGFFFVGPLLSRWNLYLLCKLRSRPPIRFILTKALLNTLLFAPLVLAGVIVLFDHKYFEKADKKALEKVWCEKYAKPFIEILRINFLTRPVVAVINCLLMPRPLRRPIRGSYELALAIFASREFSRGSYGMTFEEYTKQKTEAEKKAKPPLPPPHTDFCNCMQYLFGWWWMDCCKDCVNNSKKPGSAAKK